MTRFDPFCFDVNMELSRFYRGTLRDPDELNGQLPPRRSCVFLVYFRQSVVGYGCCTGWRPESKPRARRARRYNGNDAAGNWVGAERLAAPAELTAVPEDRIRL